MYQEYYEAPLASTEPVRALEPSNILTSRNQQEAALFDTVIIDEAAQSTEPSCLIPLVLGAKRCILVGHPQQLPATVLSSAAARVAYGQSLLDRVCRAGKKVLLLDTQYRMHPAISSLPRRYFYDNHLVDDETVQGDHRAEPYHHDALKPRLGPYVFLDVPDGEEKRGRNDKSVFNPMEAELAAHVYKKLKRDYANDCSFSSVGKAPRSTLGLVVVPSGCNRASSGYWPLFRWASWVEHSRCFIFCYKGLPLA